MSNTKVSLAFYVNKIFSWEIIMILLLIIKKKSFGARTNYVGSSYNMFCHKNYIHINFVRCLLYYVHQAKIFENSRHVTSILKISQKILNNPNYIL